VLRRNKVEAVVVHGVSWVACSIESINHAFSWSTPTKSIHNSALLVQVFRSACSDGGVLGDDGGLDAAEF
jgi:hypothetical protein